jgi:hypothetical protein
MRGASLTLRPTFGEEPIPPDYKCKWTIQPPDLLIEVGRGVPDSAALERCGPLALAHNPAKVLAQGSQAQVRVSFELRYPTPYLAGRAQQNFTLSGSNLYRISVAQGTMTASDRQPISVQQAGGGAMGRDVSCTWLLPGDPQEAGQIILGGINACQGHYVAPAVRIAQGSSKKVRIEVRIRVGNLPEFTDSLEITIVPPDRVAVEFVLDATSRARRQAFDDAVLSLLHEQFVKVAPSGGYLGASLFGDLARKQEGVDDCRNAQLIAELTPLLATDRATLEARLQRLKAVKVGVARAAYLAALDIALSDWSRLQKEIGETKLILVSILRGGDDCEASSPKNLVQRINERLTQHGVKGNFQRNQAISIKLALSLQGRSSELADTIRSEQAYGRGEESHVVFAITDTGQMRAVIEAILALPDRERSRRNAACGRLRAELDKQGDKAGASRMGRYCASLR